MGGYARCVRALGRAVHPDPGDLTPKPQLNNLVGLHT
jgi:hypothetical protein